MSRPRENPCLVAALLLKRPFFKGGVLRLLSSSPTKTTRSCYANYVLLFVLGHLSEKEDDDDWKAEGDDRPQLRRDRLPMVPRGFYDLDRREGLFRLDVGRIR